jgi:YegS/Rv2252/BmrU family lipid kinase
MYHVFLLNPLAGNGKFQFGLKEKIEAMAEKENLDYMVHVTTDIGNAREITEHFRPNEDARFYAIGGDGTLNEVVNGVLNRKGRGEIGVIPCGTGDDFIRLFPSKEPFLNLEKQIRGKSIPIDAIHTDYIDGINMCNIGIDAETASDVHRFSRYMPGSFAYSVSLINRLTHKIGIDMTLTIDDQIKLKDRFMLVSLGNGCAYGGGYFAAPKAKADDGLLEITAVRPLTRLRIAALIKGYKAGTHLDDPSYAPYIVYHQGKKVHLQMEDLSRFCIDGEIIEVKEITIEILPKAINFIVPE